MPPKRGTKRDSKDEGGKKDEPPEKKTKQSKTEENENNSSQENKPTILEKGHIYFLYRPKIDTDKVSDASDVQKVYMVLKPYWNSSQCKREPTLIVLGRKMLPDIQKHSRYWGFVAEASKNLDDVAGAFKEQSYETKTKGERTIEPSRPMGSGVYEITTHNGHSHLAYMLTLPDKPHKVQKAFNIDEQASIVIAVKNPSKPSPPQGGLSGNQKADYPKSLMGLFQDRRFVSMDTTSEFLNYKYCELMLIGATEKISKELGEAGKELEKMEKKDEEHIEHIGVDKRVFDELDLEKKSNPIEPLKGEWT